VLGARVYICKPADPEAKGMIERFHDYLETSFLPGRTFTGPEDFNAQLSEWLELANGRRKRVLGCAPADRIGADLAAMLPLPLPPVAPQTGWRRTARLARDHYVRLDSNDYSVHPSVIGRRIEIHANLQRVWVTCEGKTVADHARVWARHQTISDSEHLVAAKLLRRGRLDLVRPPVAELEVETRDLASYDTALGVDAAVLEEGVR
jgi:transposase